jgi:hypothetical protein
MERRYKMKQVLLNLYEFDELPLCSKEKALNQNREININCFWYVPTFEDLFDTGINITEFDLDKDTISGNFIFSVDECVENIIRKYPDSIAYDLAVLFKKNNPPVEVFKYELLNEFKRFLREDYNNLTNDEAVADTVRSKKLLFESDGTMRIN